MASYGDDEQRCSAPVRLDLNATAIFERILSARAFLWTPVSVHSCCSFGIFSALERETSMQIFCTGDSDLRLLIRLFLFQQKLAISVIRSRYQAVLRYWRRQRSPLHRLNIQERKV